VQQTQHTAGSRIKATRKQRGLTIVELAQKIRVSRMAILNWEADRNRPGVENIHQLALALQVTEGWILGHEASASNSQRGDLPPVSRVGRLDLPLVNDLWKSFLRPELALGGDQIATLVEEICTLIAKHRRPHGQPE
jgi:transcriptional regulator with XRE-family HTH domain